MRLLTFMQMAENKKEMSFEIIQEDIQISAEQVEAFVVDGKFFLVLDQTQLKLS